MKKIFLIVAGLMLAHLSYAQEETEEQEPRQKIFTHQVGVQMNELIRQVFNFSNSTSTIANPYLLTYSVNFKKSGWGIRIGAGYNYRSFKDDDGITYKETQINDVNGRFGIEKSFFLSGKWNAGFGLDAVGTYNDDYTKTVLKSFDTTTSTVKSLIKNYGGGGMCWLRYHLTDKVLIGTEASFYYKTGNDKQDVEITQRDNTQQSRPYKTTVSTIDTDNAEGVFSLPVVFYLIVKF